MSPKHQDPNRPHRAVLFVSAEVHPLLDSGECAGDPAHKVPPFALYADGPDLASATNKLNKLLDGLKEACRG